jgi:carbonic anhydrase
MTDFDDLFDANREFIKEFKSQDLTGQAKKGLAIVTCMDSRIDPLRIIGMKAGDAKILRNAGARVTEDVLRTLILATKLCHTLIAKWQVEAKNRFMLLFLKRVVLIPEVLRLEP